MRIGLLVPNLTDQHGWGHYSLSLIKALREAGYDLAIIAATLAGNATQNARIFVLTQPLQTGLQNPLHLSYCLLNEA